MLQNLFELQLQPVISCIHCVIRNELKKGVLPAQKKGRYSDCFVYILNGKTLYTFDTYTVTSQANGVLYLPKGSRYQMNILTETYTFIFIDFDIFRENCEEFRCTFTEKVNQQQTINLFESMYRIWMSKKTAYYSHCMSGLYKLTAELILAENAKYHAGKSYALLQKSIDYIRDNYQHTDISVAEAASVSGMSTVHFGRLFKSVYHTTPIKYITSLRMERAKELLAHDRQSTVSKISEMCGYSDVFYFSKVFRKELGITPGAYRRQTAEFS